MAEKNQTTTAKHTCSVCGVTSKERILISAEKNDEPLCICVRCMPTVIHNAQ